MAGLFVNRRITSNDSARVVADRWRREKESQDNGKSG
jgi:hypothetical protein